MPLSHAKAGCSPLRLREEIERNGFHNQCTRSKVSKTLHNQPTSYRSLHHRPDLCNLTWKAEARNSRLCGKFSAVCMCVCDADTHENSGALSS